MKNKGIKKSINFILLGFFVFGIFLFSAVFIETFNKEQTKLNILKAKMIRNG